MHGQCGYTGMFQPSIRGPFGMFQPSAAAPPSQLAEPMPHAAMASSQGIIGEVGAIAWFRSAAETVADGAE
jgi:hypothetical protein